MSLEAALQAADQAMRPLLDAIDLDDFAAHNTGYEAYGDDRFARFIGDERKRFEHALPLIHELAPHGRIVDLGCFLPHLPVALARLGHEVTIVERFELYGQSFEQELRRTAEAERLEVVDLDLSTDSLARLGRPDVVLLMSVLEHLNGSPRSLLERTREIVASEGFIYVDVPNIASLENRLRALKGRSPLPDYAVYLNSSYPFSGHNREMTTDEVRLLLEATGFRVERLETFDYIPAAHLSRKRQALRRTKRLLPGSLGELVAAVGRPA